MAPKTTIILVFAEIFTFKLLNLSQKTNSINSINSLSKILIFVTAFLLSQLMSLSELRLNEFEACHDLDFASSKLVTPSKFID